MTNWNYRVMRREYKMLGNDETHYAYQMHEVFYDNKGNPDGWTAGECAVSGETIDDMRQSLECQKLALEKPVLDYATGQEIE